MTKKPTDVWPISMETTAILGLLAFFVYGLLLGYLIGAGRLG